MSDKKVILATWVGGSAEHTIDDVTLKQGVQQQVHAATAKRLETEYPAQAVVVHTTEGSKEDERVPDYSVPPQADEEPATPDWPAAATDDAVVAPSELDQHDSTPLEPSPKEQE